MGAQAAIEGVQDFWDMKSVQAGLALDLGSRALSRWLLMQWPAWVSWATDSLKVPSEYMFKNAMEGFTGAAKPNEYRVASPLVFALLGRFCVHLKQAPSRVNATSMLRCVYITFYYSCAPFVLSVPACAYQVCFVTQHRMIALHSRSCNAVHVTALQLLCLLSYESIPLNLLVAAASRAK